MIQLVTKDPSVLALVAILVVSPDPAIFWTWILLTLLILLFVLGFYILRVYIFTIVRESRD